MKKKLFVPSQKVMFFDMRDLGPVEHPWNLDSSGVHSAQWRKAGGKAGAR